MITRINARSLCHLDTTDLNSCNDSLNTLILKISKALSPKNCKNTREQKISTIKCK